jgi:putative ABC transport system permease protein
VRGALFLALRYLAAAPGRAAVLVLGLALALALPLFTGLAAERVEAAWTARARSSPVLIGRVGNQFDLSLSALYFRGRVRDPVPYAALAPLRAYGQALPLYVSHSVGGVPLVGTDRAYFDARGLTPSAGRLPALLGEVVAGAALARDRGLAPGDRLRTDQSNLYNLAGAYPLLVEVVGVLGPSGGPDDDAFFTDVKTTWVLDGHLHGHEAVQAEDAVAADGENLEASAGLFLFSELTDANRERFHLHGDLDALPISAALVLPASDRARDQLLGDFALEEDLEAVRPIEVVQAVMSIVLRLREGLSVYFGAVAISTLAFCGLVISLSLRLRRRELALMRRIGCGRWTLAQVVIAELAIVLAAAALAAAGMAWCGAALLERALGG